MSEESFGEDEDWETGSDGPHALSTDGEWSDCQSDVDEPPPKRRGLGSWTDEDIAEFRHLCYSGTKGPALQKIFGLTADQVKKRKRDLQLTNLDKNPAALPSLSLLQTVWTKRLDGEIPLCEMRPLAAAIAEAAVELNLSVQMLKAHMKQVPTSTVFPVLYCLLLRKQRV